MNALVRQLLGEEKPPCYTIAIECSGQAVEELIPLLRELEHMGKIGSSRRIKIEGWDGKTNFGFDGDGAAKIASIKVNGKEAAERKKEGHERS